MRIIAKAAIDQAQIEAKLECGCDGFELQMRGELLDSVNGGLLGLAEAYSLALLDGINVVAVHTPLLSGIDSYFEYYLQEYPGLLEASFALAQMCSDKQKHPVRLVVHTALSVAEPSTRVWLTRLAGIAVGFPGVIVALENVLPVDFRNGNVELKNNFLFDAAILTRMLQNSLGKERVCTVLDTCHAQMSLRFVNAVRRCTEVSIPRWSLEDFFKYFSSTLGCIHLATYKGGGYGRDHGIGFKSGDPSLKNIVDLYKKYGNDCDVVIEVREDDYTNCISFEETKRCFLELFQ